MTQASDRMTDISWQAGAWDYIIVGAGSAGCVLANRLSADPRSRVLLLEAGGNDNRLKYKVPVLGALKGLGSPDSDWMFMTEPDQSRGGRVDLWPRGKVLGGSSSINGTIYVRGNRGDYDHWRQMGNVGWSYEELLPYFRRVENDKDGLDPTYGKGGAVTISETRGSHPLAHVFVKALLELGVPRNKGYNGEVQLGAAITHTTQERGWRYSAARGYLHPIRSRKNLRVVTGALAHRVMFDGKRAIGLEYSIDGHVQHARAEREVILAASAINSPKLLMLSGIGDGEMLSSMGIDVIHANRHVGRNLQEHACMQVKAIVNVSTSNTENTLFGRARHALNYALNGAGPASYVLPALCFVKSRPELEYPDLQIQFGPMGYDLTETGLRMLEEPAITLQPNVNRTQSRGYLTLRSTVPQEPPVIYPNMMGDKTDLHTLAAGGRISRSILHTKAFASFFVREHSPGPAVASDEEWNDYVRGAATACHHPCGTCKMGTGDDAVVDPTLKVVGVERLRVIDSSIIPQIPSGNLNSISMVIGEKGSDLVCQSR